MVKSNRGKIVFILFVFFAAIVFAQDKQGDDNKELREEILAVYKSRGEKGLRDYVKKNQDKISNTFIVDFAKSGVKGRNEEWLEICLMLAEQTEDKKTLADVLHHTGKYYYLISENIKAVDYLNKALSKYKLLNDPVGQGNVLQAKGKIYYYIGESSRAMEMYQKALPFFKKSKDLKGQGNVYFRKGDIYLRIGENSKALEMYEKALLFFEKVGYLIGQGNVYLRRGEIYSYTGDNSRALKMYDKALPLFEKAGSILGQGNVYMLEGDIYENIGENLKALEMYDKALPFYEKARSPLNQGNIYLSKGNIYFYTGDNSRALEIYDKALILFEKAGSHIGQGNVHLNKGDIYLRIDDNSKALGMYEKALPFFEKEIDPIGQGNVYLRKGDIYSNTGDNSRALQMYDKALVFYKKSGYTINQGIVYLSKGDIYRFTRDYSRSVEMYDKALPLLKKAGDPIGQGNLYLSKGDIYRFTGDHSKALKMYDKALPFFEKAGDISGQGNVHLSKGAIYSSVGENLKSLEMHNKALPFYKKLGSIDSESISLQGKARVWVKLGQKEKALGLFEKAIDNLEKVRTQTAFSEMKRTFLEKVYDQYEEAVIFMLENKYDDKSFKYAEMMRTRVFLDRLGEELVRLEKGLPPDLKEKRDNLVAKLSLLSKEIHKTAGGKDEKKLKVIKKQYHKIENELEELLIKIRSENPLYASVRYPQPVPIQVLQKEVLKKGEILVRYFISPEKLYVFLVSKKKFKVVSLKINKEEIDGLAKRYLLAIKENNSNDIRRFSSLLYEKLFKPLEKRLKKSRDIIVIPDGYLATIPFESLIMDNKKSGRPVFLLGKYRIKYVQSASILSVLRKHYQRDRETKNFIGFGDPVYDYENFRQAKPEQGSKKIFATESTEVTEPIFSHEDTRKDAKEKRLSSVPSVSSVAIEDEIKEIHCERYARAGGIMNRLPHSGEEIKTIARLFEQKSQKCKIHLRDHASEEHAKSMDLKEFDYIHFSCHGLLNDDFQSLVLSQIPGAKEDGYLTLNEIMNCDYNAKLVVLSACQTGAGKMERAEGVTGLTRAVMYAGTPAVMASLWKVDDTATKELMVKFYKNMLEKNMDKAEALRQAKLELIKNKKYTSPLFWSAFVLYGE
jgi:tetratricopeptide (TPR) repeat protein